MWFRAFDSARDPGGFLLRLTGPRPGRFDPMILTARAADTPLAPGSLLNTLLVIAIALPVAVVQASFFEWAFHRYWLHRPWLPKEVFTAHTLVHHQLCKFDDTFHVVEEEQEEALSFQWWGGPLLILINLVPWAIAALSMILAGVEFPYLAFFVPFTSVFALYYAGYEGLHYLMHKPSLPWIERSWYFRFIERHHRIHHVHMDRNLNVLLPLADLLLGTLVLRQPEPATTPEGARRLARRHSQFGKRHGDGSL
jgi:hypothetical protein